MFKKYLVKILEKYIDERIEYISKERTEHRLNEFGGELGFVRISKFSGREVSNIIWVGSGIDSYKWVKKPTTITKEEAEKKLDLKIK